MRRLYLPGATLLLWLCATIPPVHAAADFDARLDAILLEEGLTGISWATLSPDTGKEYGAHGKSDAALDKPFSTNTKVHVGSVAKTILATGILRLVSEGKLDLYTPVQDYLPGLSFDNPWHETAPVRLRHLLDHTAGLNDAFLWQMFSEEAGPDSPLQHAFSRTPEALQIRSRPGTRLSYSNMGYALLGLVIERVTGERYETYLDRTLLAPLGMHDSSFSYSTQDPGAKGYDPRLAMGHYDSGATAAASPIYLRPAGQFTTTPGDMAHFMTFLMSDGMLAGAQFIDRELMKARGKPLGTEAAASGLEAGYALGLGRRDRFGSVGYCHRGNINGYAAMMCLYPDEQKAFFYSINTDSETADYSRIEEIFVNRLAPAPAMPATADLMASDIRDWEGTYTLAPNRFQSFEMFDIMNASLTVTFKDSAIVLTPFGGKDRVLQGTGDYLFSAEDRATNSHIFMIDENGKHIISDGFRTYEKSTPAVVYGHWLSLGLAVVGLVWIILAVSWTLVRHGLQAAKKHPLHLPFLATIGLLVPLPFFFLQSFMALGDMTLAAVLLAAATLALPATAILAHIGIVGKKLSGATASLHAIACIAVLQFAALLFYYGMMPLILWTL